MWLLSLANAQMMDGHIVSLAASAAPAAPGCRPHAAGLTLYIGASGGHGQCAASHDSHRSPLQDRDNNDFVTSEDGGLPSLGEASWNPHRHISPATVVLGGSRNTFATTKQHQAGTAAGSLPGCLQPGRLHRIVHTMCSSCTVPPGTLLLMVSVRIV
jgi:hypothetical protein